MPLNLSGPNADKYRSAIEMFDKNQTATGWRRVTSSVNAEVYFSAETNVFLKIFLNRNRLEPLKARLRGSRCNRARKNGDYLLARGFNTPACHCWGSLSNGREFMVTLASPGQGVSDYIRDTLARDKTASGLITRREFFQSLGDIIGLLHRAGIVHGDLRTSNILVEANQNKFQFHFIDNERNSSHNKAIPLRLIKKNLVQLNMLLPSEVNRGARWHFFQSYCAVYGRFSRREAWSLAIETYQTAMQRLRNKGKL